MNLVLNNTGTQGFKVVSLTIGKVTRFITLRN